jgi:2'-5' RNA ligase
MMTHRVYYARWPDAMARTRLAAAAAPLAAGAGGRPVLPENLHLTLAFVGAVAPAVLGALLRFGASIAWPAVTLGFDGCEWWSKPQALVLTASAPPEPLVAARAALCAQLAAHGLELDPRPFRAHVTIARDVRHAPPAAPVGVEWTATGVALVESEPAPGASRYRPLALWETQGSAAGFHVV